MFYVKWFGQFTLVMVLVSIVALLVPPPAIAGLILIAVIVWAIWLLTRLMRHLIVPSNPTLESTTDSSPDAVLGAQVALRDSLVSRGQCFTRPPVAQRVKAENAAGIERTCCPRIRTRKPREFRGRSISLSFVHCRVRRRLPA